jgi:ATP-dependent RNA helicase DDX1
VPDSIHHVILRVDPQQNQEWKGYDKSYETDGVHANDRFDCSKPNAECLSEAVKLLKSRLIVKAIKAINIDQAIVFCRTKVDCDHLEKYLQCVAALENDSDRYSCVCLHADRNSNERLSNLATFKAGRVRFLICTDVAARGIDVKGIPFVIQMTLPDDKANYLHRIGRVGRADRMGLAISLVSTTLEKVWYHSNCRNRGKGCVNTNLVDQKGCCIWYNEIEVRKLFEYCDYLKLKYFLSFFQLLADIEEHLKSTIQEIHEDFKIEVSEFDGKVVYGQKRIATSGFSYTNHVAELADTVAFLSQLEEESQLNFLRMSSMKKIKV